MSAEIPTFYPTYDEFKDFSAFIASIEERGAHRIGLAKIVPPKEWKARQAGYKQKQVGDTLVENPIKQEVHGKDGLYSVFNIQQRSVKLNYFQRLATSTRYAAPSTIGNDYEKLEKKYWQSFNGIAPIYGADVGGSLYDEDQRIWNVNNLGTILDDLATDYGTRIQGVNTAYLYFGMWRASFAWHTEDMDLYSINYLHFGAPKQWYVIPPSSGRKFEQFALSKFPTLAKRCPAFLRHKMTIISPNILTKNDIPYSKIIQYENEFIITFPFGYHAGFNYGFNCAESTNFALERWIEYGKHSIKCTCREDMVKISMDRFVAKYQPDQYEDWCRGINRTPHPEDPSAQKVSSSTAKSSIRVRSKHIEHQERIADERYACIFRNLAKFDKQNGKNIDQCRIPLIRAALNRAAFKMEKNPEKNATKLLCLTARRASSYLPSISLQLFSGLKQSGKYREDILEHLWNYQSFDLDTERNFNQWLFNKYSPCTICSLITAVEAPWSIVNDRSDELLECSICQIHVHRVCYENICLSMNVEISNDDNDMDQSWKCQRCRIKEQTQIERNTSETIDDRCTACLLRGGLLLQPSSSESFIHALCSIAQAYSSSLKQHNCYYCWSFCPLNYRQISSHTFASCQYEKCSQTFHLTCGIINGCFLSFDHDKTILDARCHLHVSTVNHRGIERSSTTNIDEDENIVTLSKRVPNGTRVVVENRFGEVLSHEVTYHYSVDFGDDTFSNDMLPEDILDSNPTVGSTIRIRWTDGTIYSCKYLGRKRVLLYRIQLDRDIRQLQRHEFSLVDVRPPSPPPTPSQTESESNSNSNRSWTSTVTKRTKEQKPVKAKRRCCRLLLSSSSSSSSEDES